KYLFQSVSYAQEIASEMIKGNFAPEVDESHGRFPVILKELGFNFSKVIETLRELNNVTASGFDNYREMIGEINEMADYQNRFTQKVKDITGKFSAILQERNARTSSLEKIIEKTSASA